MQQTTTSDAIADSKGRQSKVSSSRRSIKNLQQEVELIFSQDSDEELEATSEVPAVVTTPKRRKTRTEQPKTPRLTAVLQEAVTPRRSVRKSVKTVQDYEDIVGSSKKRLRSAKRTNSDVENVDAVEERQAEEEAAPRWTPAKVGRVSKKRSKRSQKKRADVRNELAELQVEEVKDNEVMEEEVEEPLVVRYEVEEEIISTENDAEKVDEHLLEVVEKANEDRALLEEEKQKEQEIKKLEKSEENDKSKVRSLDLTTVGENSVKIIKPEAKQVSNSVDENIAASEKNEENFGSYLKSKDINVSDLGLNPLEAAAELEEKDEMDSLIVYDEEVVDENSKDVMELNENKAAEKENEKEKINSPAAVITLNDTFNTSDCYIVTPPTMEETKESVTSNTAAAAADIADDDVDCFMQPLLLSDEEETENIAPPTKTPKILLTNADDLSETLLSAKGPPDTPQSLRPKSYRFPTPYKSKESFKFNQQEEKVEVELPSLPSTSTAIVLTTMEPKDIVLRSIRKRSLSVCVDGKQQRQLLPKRVINRVTFHSPANQTAVIEDLDALIAKSTKQMELIRQAGNNQNGNNVTKRRKRSMSFDESLLSQVSKLPRPVVRPNTPNKQRQTPQKPAPAAPRTKLPNFAAIHQKHFNKMENLVEHVSRKAERAKELVNSAHKTVRPVSAQKGLLPRNEVNVKPRDKPKASKKIELLSYSEELNVSTQLPNPRLAIIKPLPAPTIVRKKPVATTTKSQATPPKRVLRPTAQTLAPTAAAVAAAPTKPAFNLSTHVAQAPTLFSAPTTAAAVAAATEDKLAARRKRHMQMFKGRSAETRTTRDGVVIRGVRSNRRFELQMQHRRNLEQS